MNGKRTMVIVCLLIIFCFLPGKDVPPVETQIKQTLTAMWAAIEAGDVTRYAQYLHPGFTAFGESDAFLAVGKELEIRNITAWLKTARHVHTEMLHPLVTVRGDVAWITYYWADSGVDNGKPVTSKGKSTRIFVRENSAWL